MEKDEEKGLVRGGKRTVQMDEEASATQVNMVE